MNGEKKKGSIVLGFFPILVFVVVYLGMGIYYQIQGVEYAFYQFPAFGGMFLGLVVAFLIGKEPLEEKFKIYVSGIANDGVATMLLVYIFAGAFSGVTSAMGGQEATVNLGLSLIPVQFLAAGVFIVSAFIGTATGTSVGTVSAVAPIAIGVAAKADLNVALVVGACVGGAMFGDNLSMISDTTIAATSTQGVQMKDKFLQNFLIALPAAICNIILLLIFGSSGITSADLGDLSYNFILVVPYLLVFIIAIIGVNVLVVLAVGIIAASVIGIATGAFSFAGAATAAYSGVTGMDEIFYLTLLCAGLGAFLKARGGIDALLGGLRKVCHGAKSSQLVIAFEVFVLDLATATNTIAIILSGEVARDVSKEYKIDPRRTAALLDIFSCVPQGMLPYSGQLMVASAYLAAYGYSLSAVNLVPYIWYCLLLGVFGILSIFIPYADVYSRKHPWNWGEEEAAGEALKEEA